ncbi:MAG: hypothetical protein JNN05_02305 [Candidatus Omnitrophica bacterium]|nr:hypothetical protein [Candidatus Omnitrophota bacterium]
MIGEVPGEAVILPNDEDGNFFLVEGAILGKILEFGPVLRLGAFAALHENPVNLKSLLCGKLPARVLLTFEAVSFLGLLFC